MKVLISAVLPLRNEMNLRDMFILRSTTISFVHPFLLVSHSKLL